MNSHYNLEVSNLTKTFGNKLVIDDVSFNVKKNGLFVLLGSNGSGKSVLINCLLGFELIDEGNIIVLDKPINERLWLRKHTGIVSSDHMEHLYLFTPNECFNFISEIYNLDFNTVDMIIRKYAFMLGIESYLDVVMYNLSFGTKKKVQLLINILYKPSILFCDEIFEGLDEKSVLNVKEILIDYVKEGRSVFLTTHIFSLVKDMSPIYYELKDNKIVSKSW